MTRRPFVAVHAGATRPAMIGGGDSANTGIQVGEVTLAHRGILFLDELPEFERTTLEALRQPLEDREVHISRVYAKVTLPADVTLVAAMNSCKCGWYGTGSKCTCSIASVQAYQRRVSGPIMDRIDLKIPIMPLTVEERFAPPDEEWSTAKLRQKIAAAREIQRKRFDGTGIASNSRIPAGRLQEFYHLADTKGTFELVRTLEVSTRAMDRMIKLARTLADLDGAELIELAHVEQAAKLMDAWRPAMEEQ